MSIVVSIKKKKGLPERAENSSEERWAENPLKICL
jgi:hypothetical protein